MFSGNKDPDIFTDLQKPDFSFYKEAKNTYWKSFNKWCWLNWMATCGIMPILLTLAGTSSKHPGFDQGTREEILNVLLILQFKHLSLILRSLSDQLLSPPLPIYLYFLYCSLVLFDVIHIKFSFLLEPVSYLWSWN